MLATAGDLVFTGDPEGNFFALDARTGNKLWSFQTGAGHRGGSISYSVGGRQYIAVTTGFQQTLVGGAAVGIVPRGEFPPGVHVGGVRIAGGIAMKQAFFFLALAALAMFSQAQDLVKQGEAVFSKSCATGYCHGARGTNGGAPRLAARGFDQDFIRNTVTSGVPNTAMPAFANTLSRADLNAVVAYVASLNGVTNPTIVGNGGPPGPASRQALRRRGPRPRSVLRFRAELRTLLHLP